MIYIDTENKSHKYPLNEALANGDPEMTKKLKYTKNLLMSMIKD